MLCVNAPWLPPLLPHLELTFAQGCLPSRAFTVAPDADVEPGFADGESAKGHIGKPLRKLGVDVQVLSRRVCAEAEDCLPRGTGTRCSALVKA